METPFIDLSKTFVDHILSLSAEYPDRVVLVDERRAMTLRELDEESSRLALCLASMGVTAGHFVAISLPRTNDFVVSILAVLRLGAAYVPIDMQCPQQRKDFILADSEVRLCITPDVLAKAAEYQTDTSINFSYPEGLAYMLYTSGTTGKPKGVVGIHKAIVALINSCSEIMQTQPTDKFLAVSSFSFVALFVDLFCALSAGACVVIASEKVRKDVDAIRRYIIENKINKLFASTPLGSLLINSFPDVPLERIMMGGEKMLPLKRTAVKIVNAYGSTETTAGVLYHAVNQEVDLQIPLGKPVQGVSIFVCDENGNLLPQGEEGELMICSEQLAVGYWHQIELTSERFVACPFLPGKRMYKTGDRVRQDASGNIVFVGRKDGQVKLRRLRIELGEIESCAATFEGIKACAATVFGQQLCLYYESDAEVDNQALAAHLAQSLVDYMVPTYFERLDKIPLNHNGKKDRKALPEPKRSETFEQPQTESEKAVFAITAELLGTSDFGVDTNLISVGMSSLTAMSLSVEIEKRLGAVVKYNEIFDEPKVGAIARKLGKKTENQTFAKQKFYPLSGNQKAMYLEWQLNPLSTKYNLPWVVFFAGAKADDLQRAIKEAVNAHSALKRRIMLHDGEIVQQPCDDDEVAITVQRIENQPSADFYRQFILPFDLLAEPLYRFQIFETSSGCNLFYDIHHLAFDGLSSVIFERDLQRAFEGEALESENYTAFEQVLSEERWLESQQYAEAQHYFRNLLADGSPFAYRKSAKLDNTDKQSASIKKCFDAKGVRAFCKQNAYTSTSFFAAMLSELLQRTSQEENIVVSILSNGRNSLLHNSVGMFVRTLPLLCKSTENDTLDSVVAGMKQQFSTTRAYGLFPYQQVVQQLGGAPKLLFTYQGGIDTVTDTQNITFAVDDAIEPLTVMVCPLAKEQFVIEVLYDTSIYSQADVEVFAESYKSLILNAINVVCDSVKDIPILSPEAQKEILLLSKGKDLEYNQNETFVDLVLRHAAQNPDSIAVKDSQSSLTYRQLDEQSNILAHKLIAQGVKVGDFVCLTLPRTKEFIVAMLGVMRAGAAYVPVDLDYPAERQEYMIADSECTLVITEEFLAQALKEKEQIGESINCAAPQGRAYMIYTSGTSGRPKGVVVRHISLRAYVAHVVDVQGVTRQSRHLLTSSFSFDASVHDIFSSLSAGAMLVVASDVERKNLTKLHSLIVEKSDR